MVGIKKDFIVRRTITEVEGKQHVETYSEQELIRCKNCRHRDPEDNKCDCGGMPWNIQILPVPDDWFCPNGER